jgi:hypothetical protein
VTDALWDAASADIEAEHTALRLTRAKVACASLWPFLANAASTDEFTHRLALVDEHIAARVDDDLIEPVTASLREDFRAIAAQEYDQFDAKRTKQLDDLLGPRYHPNDFGGAHREPWGGQQQPHEESVPYPEKGRPGHWPEDDPTATSSWIDHFGPEHAPHLPQTPDQHLYSLNSRHTALEDDANKGQGNPAYFSGGPEGGPATGETNQFPPHPTGSDPMDPINAQYPAQPQPWTVTPGTEWREEPMQFGATRKTAEVGDTDTCRTCGNAVRYVKGDGQHFWSHSGQDGWEHDDHHVPHPQRYPHEGARGRRPFEHVAGEGVIPTPGPNPNYFTGGPEGIAGEQSGFPADMAAEDPEDWANSYGAAPPTQSVSPYTAAVETIKNPSPDSDDNAGTEFDSDAERERYQKSQKQGNRFYDPFDPSIRMVAVGEGDPYGGDNPFVEQGQTGAGGTPATPPTLEGGPGAAVSGDADGGVPLTTKPRQMPGGMAPAAPSVSQDNTPQMTASLSFDAFMRTADSQNLFSEDDPTGYGDPYRGEQYEKARGARPRMDVGQMGINTPQKSREPIRTVTSDPSAAEEREEEEGER